MGYFSTLCVVLNLHSIQGSSVVFINLPVSVASTCTFSYSTGRRNSSTYTHVKCVQYGVFKRKIQAKYTHKTRV